MAPEEGFPKDQLPFTMTTTNQLASLTSTDLTGSSNRRLTKGMPDRKPPQRELAETPKQEKSQRMGIGLSL
jgi:hypothetical protein